MMATTKAISIGNLIKHYNNRHKGIPISEAEEKQLQTKKLEFF
jgi:hypothetical protein